MVVFRCLSGSDGTETERKRGLELDTRTAPEIAAEIRVISRCTWSVTCCYWQDGHVNSPYGNTPRPSSQSGGDVCTCCKRPWTVCVGESRRFSPQSRQLTCPPCHGHGPNAIESDRVHKELWRLLGEKQAREHRAEVDQLREQIAQLEQKLADRPVKEVQRFMDADELREYKDEADRAFRSRENAWQALCEIRLIHREGEPGRCRCGTQLHRCPIAEIVDRYPGLAKWEEEQIRRLRSGNRHMLPDRHPAVLDRRYQPD